jgi:nucleoside-diphosphate-sugar epimerase
MEDTGRRGADVLVTGVTGYTDSEIVDALVAAGYQALGSRYDESARKLEERGSQAVMSPLMNAGSLREAAREADAVVRVTLMHGEGAEEAERTAVGAVLDVLRGTGRTFVDNSGVWS